MLIQRIITAVIAIPFLAAAIQWGGPSIFSLIIAVAAGIALYEFLTMIAVQSPISRLFMLAAGVSIVLLVHQCRTRLLYEGLQFQNALAGKLMIISVLLTIAAMLSLPALYPRKTPLLVAPVINLLGILYISLFLSYLILLYNGQDGKAWIFFVLLVLWCNDSGAYACGRTLGRHKLSPLVSPNKTVEGAIGGVVISLIAAVIAKMFLLKHLSLTQAAALGLVIALAGQAGDLCESALKRHFGLKDSGSVLPGHGGMLDRIDSLLLAAPFVYYAKLLIV